MTSLGDWHPDELYQEAWAEARSKSDFASFAPHLRRNLELAQRYVECFDDFDRAYDVLLDDYEPGMKTAQVAALFAELRDELQPLIATLREHSERVDDSCLHGSFPIARQRRLVSEVVELMGFDPSSWRMDDTVHPFATNIGAGDTRITTRWNEGHFAPALYGAMHECGHGLYEAGIEDVLKRTPLGHGESLGLHESQSRLWDNTVGRSRAFWEHFFPLARRTFPQALRDIKLGHLDHVPAALALWNKVTDPSGVRFVDPVLVHRREAEGRLWRTS